jgi:hypothetical protein
MNPLNSLELYEKKYKRKNKEVEIELSKFSNLFNLIVEEYDKDNDKRLERKKEDVIYRSLCLNCHKNKVCYSKDGILKDLMLKSIEGELNDDEVSFMLLFFGDIEYDSCCFKLLFNKVFVDLECKLLLMN